MPGQECAERLVAISERLRASTSGMSVSSGKITHVYEPLNYAHEPHVKYLQLYGASTASCTTA